MHAQLLHFSLTGLYTPFVCSNMTQAAISVDALVLADTFRWNQVLSKVCKKTKQTKRTPSVLYFFSLTLNDLVNRNYHTVDCCQQMVLTLAETLSDQVSPLAVNSWDFVAQIVLLLSIKLTLQIDHAGMFTWAAVGVFIGMSLLGISHRRTVSAGCTNTHMQTQTACQLLAALVLLVATWTWTEACFIFWAACHMIWICTVKSDSGVFKYFFKHVCFPGVSLHAQKRFVQ